MKKLLFTIIIFLTLLVSFADQFDIIETRNIFNNERMPRSIPIRNIPPPRTNTPPPKIDYIVNRGMIDFDNKSYAFFEGNQSGFNGVRSLSNNIAGYRITDIQSSFVRIESETNFFILPVGGEIRRTNNGPWKVLSNTMQIASDISFKPTSPSRRSPNNNGGRNTRNIYNMQTPPQPAFDTNIPLPSITYPSQEDIQMSIDRAIQNALDNIGNSNL